MKRTREDAEWLVQEYGDLARKLAWEFWKKLPPAAKIWIGPEDMIAEAYLCFVEVVQKRYDKNRAARSTFIWWALKNMFVNICLRHTRGMRLGMTFSLEELLAPDMVSWMGQKDSGIFQAEALDALSSVFSQATPKCRDKMREWFGQEIIYPHKDKRTEKVYRQFRRLAKRAKLGPQDCLELMKSGVSFPCD